MKYSATKFQLGIRSQWRLYKANSHVSKIRYDNHS